MIANAANGGLFGEIMNLILTGDRNGDSGKNWEIPGDGTVRNALTLSGISATSFQKIATPNQSCGLNQCIYGFDPSGNILCR